MVALDVDGTTVRHDGVTISSRVRAAIRRIHRAGHHVVLSTGRSPAATLPVTAALELANGFAVCANGAVTVRLDTPDRYTVVSHATFDPREVLAMLRRTLPSRAVAVELPGGRGYRVTDSWPDEDIVDEVRVVPWDELCAGGAGRLIVRAGPDAGRIAGAVAALGLDCLADTIGPAGSVEITSRGVSKAFALEAVRTALGVRAADTIAVGDHLNDAGMLGWAARGIAMGHAPAAVKAIAGEVVAGCDEDGLADVLEPLVAGRAGTVSG